MNPIKGIERIIYTLNKELEVPNPIKGIESLGPNVPDAATLNGNPIKGIESAPKNDLMPDILQYESHKGN